MNAMMQTTTFPHYVASTLAARAVIFALVVTAHLAVLSVWSKQPNANAVTVNELSVSFAMAAQAPQPATPQPHKSTPAALPEQVAVQSPSAVMEQATAVAAPSVALATPVIADTEPDYKASYLNNPPPAYPMVARRNGLQGRVVLNVEVLADGICGQINIHKSSGYAMLDNAALLTVKTWRFLPARQAGRTVDKWFMIPIQFSLKDDAA